MSYEIKWLVPGRIVYERFYGTMTLEELQTIVAQFVDMVKDGEAPVHCLIDARDVSSYPTKINELRSAVGGQPNEKIGLVLFVTTHPVIRFLTAVLGRLSMLDSNMRSFSEMDSALQHLRESDSTLVDVPMRVP